jgi:hypothetical protein
LRKSGAKVQQKSEKHQEILKKKSFLTYFSCFFLQNHGKIYTFAVQKEET